MKPLGIDRKTRLTMPVGLLWAILVAIITATAMGQHKLDEIDAKLDGAMSTQQFQEWRERLLEANTPWHKAFVVPSVPSKNEAYGQRTTESVAEAENK